MQIQALAVDYDGTIARHNTVEEPTRLALEALRNGGRRLILVTGRQLEELRVVFPHLDLFDRIVAENGAVIHDPKTDEVTTLGEAPSPAFLAELTRRDVPFVHGHVVVATWTPHDADVLAAIHEVGLEWQVIYNKGAVMALPSGVTKATGLTAALAQLGLSPHNAAAIGDAENDHSFLRICEVAAAVRNALPAIKERADVVMRRANGAGVAEFIQRYLLDDRATLAGVLRRYTVELGVTRSGAPFRAPVYGANALIVGESGSGKSTLTGVLVERLLDQAYQVCVIDPEGDHAALEPLITLGSVEARPALEEISAALERSTAGVVVNLVALSLPDKAQIFADLLAGMLALRASRGQPHWIVLDEAHHFLPAQGGPALSTLPADLEGLCLISLHAELLSAEALARITHLYVVGPNPAEQLARFAAARGLAPLSTTETASLTLLPGEALMAPVEQGKLGRPQRFRMAARRTEHRRHLRKYAGGDMRDDSFYFRGAEGRLNLRAYNVTVFIEMARGVDADTWAYHLQRGDIATWFRERVKDPESADLIESAAAEADGSPAEEARAAVLRLLETRYTAGSGRV